jgi:hypothetical protein
MDCFVASLLAMTSSLTARSAQAIRLRSTQQRRGLTVFGKVANGFRSNKDLWLWVPAFAGTTNSMVHSQIHISNNPA